METRLRNYICTRVVKMLTPHGEDLQSDYIAELFNQPPPPAPDVTHLQSELNNCRRLLQLQKQPVTEVKVPLFSAIAFLVVGMLIATVIIMYIRSTTRRH